MNLIHNTEDTRSKTIGSMSSPFQGPSDLECGPFYTYPELELSDTESLNSGFGLDLLNFGTEEQTQDAQFHGPLTEDDELLEISSLESITDSRDGSLAINTQAQSEDSSGCLKLMSKKISKRKPSSGSLFTSSSILLQNQPKRSKLSSIKIRVAGYRRAQVTKKIKFVTKTKKVKKQRSTFPMECEVVYERLEEEAILGDFEDDQLLDCESFSDCSSVQSEEDQTLPAQVPCFNFGNLVDQINRSKRVNSLAANACYSTFRAFSRLSSNITEESSEAGDY